MKAAPALPAIMLRYWKAAYVPKPRLTHMRSKTTTATATVVTSSRRLRLACATSMFMTWEIMFDQPRGRFNKPSAIPIPNAAKAAVMGLRSM